MEGKVLCLDLAVSCSGTSQAGQQDDFRVVSVGKKLKQSEKRALHCKGEGRPRHPQAVGRAGPLKETCAGPRAGQEPGRAGGRANSHVEDRRAAVHRREEG